MDTPAVSVICLVYNMKDYLRDTFEGFLLQKTDFPFEVIVHDDASTDGSTEIVREYAEKYPDLFVPIIQTENKYSQKIPITMGIILPAARGKYSAYCEGDDYWTDPLKLQKQYDFMESHPEYTLCCTKIRQIDFSASREPDKLIAPIGYTGEVTLEQILKLKEKQPLCTCSMFFRTDVMLRCPPEFPSSGERMKTIWLGLQGKIWNIDEETGVYRRARPGSWTESSWYTKKEQKLRVYYNRIANHMFINDYSGKKYDEYFQDIYLEYMKLALRAGAKYRDIIRGEVSECHKTLSSRRKNYLRLYNFMLPLIASTAKIRKKLRKS